MRRLGALSRRSQLQSCEYLPSVWRQEPGEILRRSNYRLHNANVRRQAILLLFLYAFDFAKTFRGTEAHEPAFYFESLHTKLDMLHGAEKREVAKKMIEIANRVKAITLDESILIKYNIVCFMRVARCFRFMRSDFLQQLLTCGIQSDNVELAKLLKFFCSHTNESKYEDLIRYRKQIFD